MNQSDPEDKRRHCDIVMKGGITSGVVYPQAITTLAKRYTFVNIGGTSAGAIAAAIAAAAEYHRHQTKSDDGFKCLDELPTLLGEKPLGAKRTRLYYFFQPNARTRRLFEVLTGFLGGGGGRLAGVVFGRLTKQYLLSTCLGMLPGLLLGLTSWLFASGPMAIVWLILSIVLVIVGSVLAAAASFLREFIREVPRNGFGLCSGVVEPSGHGTSSSVSDGAEPLSVWLNRYLNKTAGLTEAGRPLTFGDLWANDGQSDLEKAPRRTNLEMMTTCLTHGRPYRLPFRDDSDLRENNRFYFRPDEFERYFPAKVVEWMLANPHPFSENDRRDTPERRGCLAALGLYPLPKPADLPVVVATRMSLSFPVLLSAVPLHAFVTEGSQEDEFPARCWFTDGGVCSNFPLHFFDAPLPGRPTFSIDLIDKPADTPATAFGPEMPETNQTSPERWNQFDRVIHYIRENFPAEKPALDSLVGFFGAAITTMQNWTDTTQAHLPGYRDRIVGVPLSAREGGLNLDMPAPLIKVLSERGIAAAEMLMSHFDVPPEHEVMTWDNHRWIRLRSLLGALEKMLNNVLLVSAQGKDGDLSYEDWLTALQACPDDAPSYTMKDPARLKAALNTLHALRTIAGLWPPSIQPPSNGAPRPRPILRPRAQI